MGLSYSEDPMIVVCQNDSRNSVSRFDTLPVIDGQTERRTDIRSDGRIYDSQYSA